MGRKDYIRELNIIFGIGDYPELDVVHGIVGDLPLSDLEGWIRVKVTPGSPVGFAEWEYLEEIRHRQGLKRGSVHLIMSVDLLDLERAAAVRRRGKRLDSLIG